MRSPRGRFRGSPWPGDRGSRGRSDGPAHLPSEMSGRSVDEPLKVLVLGTGRMGTGIARLLLEKAGVELAGAYGRRPRPGAGDAGEALGLPGAIGKPFDHDLIALLARTSASVAIQATCSRLEDAEGEIRTLAEAGIDVISIAEELACPGYGSPVAARELDALATARGVTVLGTGVNPGFVLDLLVIALTGVCQRVDRIKATRVNDLSPYGPTVLESQGVGMSPEAFADGLAAGTVTGHRGFPESMAMVAGALGWRLTRVEQRREPIIARVRRETDFVTVEPGTAAGCRHSAVGYVEDEPRIELVHPQQVCPEREGVETGDAIEIAGEPELRFAGRPEIPGGIATAALAVNMIPRVVAAAPGLVSMADLPVPAAIMGDVRDVLARRRRTRRDAPCSPPGARLDQ